MASGAREAKPRLKLKKHQSLGAFDKWAVRLCLSGTKRHFLLYAKNGCQLVYGFYFLFAPDENLLSQKILCELFMVFLYVVLPCIFEKMQGYKKPCTAVMAQRTGFEPANAFTLHDFQSCSLNHSDISANYNTILSKISFLSNI